MFKKIFFYFSIVGMILPMSAMSGEGKYTDEEIACCPDGYSKVGNECRERSMQKCPGEGWTMRGVFPNTICTKNEHLVVQATSETLQNCPDGFVLSDDKTSCVKDVSRCPNGGVYSSMYDVCLLNQTPVNAYKVCHFGNIISSGNVSFNVNAYHTESRRNKNDWRSKNLDIYTSTATTGFKVTKIRLHYDHYYYIPTDDEDEYHDPRYDISKSSNGVDVSGCGGDVLKYKVAAGGYNVQTPAAYGEASSTGGGPTLKITKNGQKDEFSGHDVNGDVTYDIYSATVEYKCPNGYMKKPNTNLCYRAYPAVPKPQQQATSSIIYHCPSSYESSPSNPSLCEKDQTITESVITYCPNDSVPSSWEQPRLDRGREFCKTGVNKKANAVLNDKCYNRNYWPVITAPNSISLDELKYFKSTFKAEDPDGAIVSKNIRVSGERPFPVLTSINEDDMVGVTPKVNKLSGVLAETLILTAKDDKGQIETKTIPITINPVNNEPNIIEDTKTTFTVSSKSLVNISFSLSDTDGTVSSTIQKAGPGSIVKHGRSYVEFKAPEINSGLVTSEITVKIKDNDGESKTKVFVIHTIPGKDFEERIPKLKMIANSHFLRNRDDKFSYRIESSKITTTSGNPAVGTHHLSFFLKSSPVALKLKGLDEIVHPGGTVEFDYVLKDQKINIPVATAEDGKTGLIEYRITINSTKDFIAITDINGAKQWDDGSFASSCKEYRYPTQEKYVYGGDAESGTYKIKLNGQVIDVYCDMYTQGGGWTKLNNYTSSSQGINLEVNSFVQGSEYLIKTTGNSILSSGRFKSIGGLDLYNTEFNFGSFRGRIQSDGVKTMLPSRDSNYISYQNLEDGNQCLFEGLDDHKGCSKTVIIQKSGLTSVKTVGGFDSSNQVSQQITLFTR